MVDEILEQEVAAIKETVAESDAIDGVDIAALIRAEQEREARDELLDWLEEKQATRATLRDEERIEALLEHLEHAYRTAAISEDAYQRAKEANKELLDEVRD